jgi:hypothetical protein
MKAAAGARPLAFTVMRGRRRIETGIMLLAAVVLPATAGAEPGVFVEPEVEVLQVFEGDRHGSLFGWGVSAVADVDGDGASEVLTGAPFNTLGGANAGRAYLFSGATGAPLFVWTGAAGDRLGFSIADAGDVDGDGMPDVIVGAPGGMDAPGTARIYSGATGDELAVLNGSAAADNFGVSVTGVGDVDGDGLGDVLVGAPRDPTVGLDSGRVTLFAAADWSAPLWSREGEAGMRLGGGAGPIGDVNGDAIADVVVGAHGNGGAVWVLSGDDGSDVHVPLLGDRDAVNLGQFFVAGVGDVDGDGVPDVYGGDFGDAALGPGTGRAYVWSGASGERLHTFAGTEAGEGLGCGRGAGDADGDGVPDIAVGSYSASPGGVAQAGFVTVFSGATGAVIRTITGTTELEQVGFDVVGLGDVNGDGRDDLVMSGANDDRVYLIAGVAEENGGSESSTGEEPGSSSDGSGSTAAADDGSTTGTSPPEATTSGSEPEDSGGSSSASESSEATGQGSEDPSGCGCRATRSRGGLPWLLAALGLPWLRRRARAKASARAA